jgi:hypothetical protein
MTGAVIVGVYAVVAVLGSAMWLAVSNIRGVVVSEVQDAVDAITAQVLKSREEVLARIAELEAAVAAGEVPDFTALKEAVQSVDDIVPDAPVE